MNKFNVGDQVTIEGQKETYTVTYCTFFSTLFHNRYTIISTRGDKLHGVIEYVLHPIKKFSCEKRDMND